MKNINWDNVEEAREYERLAPGGYICKITAVEDVGKNEYLRIEFDVDEGKFKGYFLDLYKSKGFWGGTFYKSYKESALSFFKAFKTSVEESNPGYIFDNDESTLVGKRVGLVLAEEEYKGNDGKIKTRLYVDRARNVESIRKGDFKIPEKKMLPKDYQQPSYQSADNLPDEELPFDL